MLGAFRTPTGQSLDVLLTEAVRAGRLGLANVPGNELADDTATYAWVPAMIRFYLGEEPLLGSVPTWVLADEDQWAQVRDRLHELVVKPVAGYGGRGTVFGPSCSAAELAALRGGGGGGAVPVRRPGAGRRPRPCRPWSTASCSPAGWTCGSSRSRAAAGHGPRLRAPADPGGPGRRSAARDAARKDTWLLG